jgi:hypothetical protein
MAFVSSARFVLRDQMHRRWNMILPSEPFRLAGVFRELEMQSDIPRFQRFESGLAPKICIQVGSPLPRRIHWSNVEDPDRKMEDVKRVPLLCRWSRSGLSR